MADNKKMDQRIIKQQVLENEDNKIQNICDNNLIGYALPEDDGNQKKYGECAGDSHKPDVGGDYELDCGCACIGNQCDCECDLNTEIECRCVAAHRGGCGCRCDCIDEIEQINDQKNGDETDNQINLLECDSRKCDDKI